MCFAALLSWPCLQPCCLSLDLGRSQTRSTKQVKSCVIRLPIPQALRQKASATQESSDTALAQRVGYSPLVAKAQKPGRGCMPVCMCTQRHALYVQIQLLRGFCFCNQQFYECFCWCSFWLILPAPWPEVYEIKSPQLSFYFYTCGFVQACTSCRQEVRP